MLKRNTLKKIAIGALWVGAAGIFSACSPKGPKFQGVDLTGAEYGRDLPLTDQFGKERSIKDFAGKVVVVFFGYTQCPDVCPTSMSELAEVKRSLGADGDKLQGIFVTVDPERDTPEMLKGYMASFDPSFIALRGTPEQLVAVATVVGSGKTQAVCRCDIYLLSGAERKLCAAAQGTIRKTD